MKIVDTSILCSLAILQIPCFKSRKFTNPRLISMKYEINDISLLELGVKTEAEKRSFIFDSRKGLEPILFDISDPTLLANVVYRIMQIRFDLDRTFFGTVVNMAGTYE